MTGVFMDILGSFVSELTDTSYGGQLYWINNISTTLTNVLDTTIS